MRRVVFWALFLALFCFWSKGAVAMPNFARQYDTDCSMCHSTVPKLNKTGYEFRRAGWRLPSEIGKVEKAFNLGDKFAARIQTKYKSTSTDNAGVKTSRSQLDFHEVTVYPITGSFDKNWSSLVEMSFLPEESAEIENAYVRYNSGSEDRFVHFRWGVMHPFEGFGASDRPVSLSRPLFQTESVNNFKIWGLDQAGAEVGYTLRDTSITATIFNGINEAGKSALGGGQVKGNGALAENNKDIQLFVNQMFGDGGAAVSAYYYGGTLGLGTVEANSFSRAALYGNLPFSSFNLLGGYELGRDNRSVSANQTSSGYFAEMDWTPISGNTGGLNVTAALRYDVFDPNTSSGNNEKSAITLACNLPYDNGFQLIGEYKAKTTKQAGGDLLENTFEIRGISIF